MKKTILFVFIFISLISTASAADITTTPSKNASVTLHMDKTTMVVGDMVSLTLTVQPIITTSTAMTAQIILIPPSGMTVISSDFSQTSGGQYSLIDKIEPGKSRSVAAKLKANEIGEFDVEGYAIYYFGEDKASQERVDFKKPIKVTSPATPAETPITVETPESPNKGAKTIIGIVVLILVLLIIYKLIKRTPAPEETTQARASAPAKFQIGPTVRLRPVTDVIEAEQDGVVEFYMENPSLNTVTLHVEARISIPGGFHIYGQGFAQASGGGTVSSKFDVPPGNARTIAIVIKADKSARIGSHILQFSGLYYPDENQDNYQQISLTYPITVKATSKEPESPQPSNSEKIPEGAEAPTAET